jgi:hypothetical protein
MERGARACQILEYLIRFFERDPEHEHTSNIDLFAMKNPSTLCSKICTESSRIDEGEPPPSDCENG